MLINIKLPNGDTEIYEISEDTEEKDVLAEIRTYIKEKNIFEDFDIESVDPENFTISPTRKQLMKQKLDELDIYEDLIYGGENVVSEETEYLRAPLYYKCKNSKYHLSGQCGCEYHAPAIFYVKTIEELDALVEYGVEINKEYIVKCEDFGNYDQTISPLLFYMYENYKLDIPLIKRFIEHGADITDLHKEIAYASSSLSCRDHLLGHSLSTLDLSYSNIELHDYFLLKGIKHRNGCDICLERSLEYVKNDRK